MSAHPADHTVLSLREQLARRERQLHAVHRITAALCSHLRLEDLIQQTLLAAIETVNASAGSILLHDPQKNRLVFRYVVGPSSEITDRLTGREMPVDQGIAGTVFLSGQGMITADVASETRHYPEIDVATRYRTRSLITVPLKTREGRAIGLIQVLNRREGIFDAEDLEVLEILSGEAASAIENAHLHEQVLHAEVEKKRFCSQVLRAVTHDKFHLVDASEIPTEGRPALEAPLETPEDELALRPRLREIVTSAGMAENDVCDLLLAAGEAANNAVKHAAEGRCAVYLTSERVIVRISDRGKGIRSEDLPCSILQPGFSTKISLGMGYTLMLHMVDRIWLATGPEGTLVQIEKWLHPEAHAQESLLSVYERF
jgi:anti-sigma regulatory factor (Ser/Thr protein kinase)